MLGFLKRIGSWNMLKTRYPEWKYLFTSSCQYHRQMRLHTSDHKVPISFHEERVVDEVEQAQRNGAYILKSFHHTLTTSTEFTL